MGAVRRYDLSNKAIAILTAVSTCSVFLYFLILPYLPEVWSTPGSRQLYLFGVAGSILTLTPFAFSIAKRGGRSAAPPTWFCVHVLCGTLGCCLLLAHSAGHFGRPPALLLGGCIFLVFQGAVLRVYISQFMAQTFGIKHSSFLGFLALDKTYLAQLIMDKGLLLQRLSPNSSEATFSPSLNHWLRHPLLSYTYTRLSRAERRLIDKVTNQPKTSSGWRQLHIAVAFLFLSGMFIHIATVTFFAGYVADGGGITWWHITDWGK